MLLGLAALVTALTPTRAWQSDNADGTYTNPPLYADYPDPDIIRVGDDFYFATTTFVNTPGLTILHSEDLVNWRIISHVIERLDGRDAYDMVGDTAYRSGVFAPSLRYHNGVFYVVVTPVGQNTRVYRSLTAEGPWEHRELDRAAFDPALFFDDDGSAYIATSGGWDGTVTLLTLNDDLSEVTASEEIFFNQGAEGSKIIKREDWYYMFHSIPSRLALTVSRARSLTGEWETRPQIDDTTGGHQGALVDLPGGGWYGFVMVDSGAIGRMTNISPIYWEDDWPVWGTPESPGRVPATAPKPITGKTIRQPATSDSFDDTSLGMQWQWNHNSDHSRWSLTERPGFLRLHATTAEDFWTARNTLNQKGQGPWCRGTVKLDLSNLTPGAVAGFGTLGKITGHIAIQRDDAGGLALSMRVINDTVSDDTRVSDHTVTGDHIYLRTDMDFRTSEAVCAYSTDGTTWRELGGSFPIRFDWRTGTFQGTQFALFHYASSSNNGYIDVDWFEFTDDPVTRLQDGQQVLIRGVGPTLADFGISTPLSDPHLTLHAGQTVSGTNDNWSHATNASEISETTGALGGFPLAAGTNDAAMLTRLSPGAYTAFVKGATDDAGVVLLELYNTAASHSRLVNLSCRGDASAGENALVAGFALAGNGAQTVLIRAVGPSLRKFGVDNVMANPVLTLFDGLTAITTNDNWGDAPDSALIQTTAQAVGAFALNSGSLDAALIATLAPGAYTAQASGHAGTRGNVLVEVYRVP